jgi:hypothetical protein
MNLNSRYTLMISFFSFFFFGQICGLEATL